MESVKLSSEPTSGKWEVYKDVFAPPSRTIKAWERAPVPAHARRLQGQKIWKRAAAKSQREQDKENFDAAQKELAKEGKGARKRMRVRGSKQNIGDAPWKDIKEDILEIGAVETANSECVTEIPPNDVSANALQYVPRKRTNANHVITPRKPLRQATLNGQAQTQGITTQSSREKPVQKRKSMRKSIRKSLAEPISDVPEIVEEKPAYGEPISSAPQHGVEAVFECDLVIYNGPEIMSWDDASAQPEKDKQAEIALNAKLNELFDFTFIEEDEQAPRSEVGEPSKDSSSLEPAVKITLNDVEAPRKHDRSEEKSNPRGDMNEDPSFRDRQLETASAILESVETGATIVRPRRASNTPKKKSGTSQRRGTRRSTRTTNASSARAEEEAPEVTAAPEAATTWPSEAGPNVAEPIVQTPVNDSETPSREAGQIGNADARETETATISGHAFGHGEGMVGNETEQSDTGRANEDIELNDSATSGAIDNDEPQVESFDISAPILSIPVVDLEPKIGDENFELPPVPDPSENVSDALEEATSAEPHSHSPSQASSKDSPIVSSSTADELSHTISSNPEEATVEFLEPVALAADPEDSTNENETMSLPIEDLPESSTPDPTTSKLVEIISENAPPVAYDHDDTDMLRNFLSRVKANKAAKAVTQIPKRKRSLPHSPLQLPLGETNNLSPSPQKTKDEFDVTLPDPSPSKRQKRNDPVVPDDDTITQRTPNRRSGRMRLPVVKTPLGAPSHIPVRRIGQDGDTTVTLKRNEEKELAALTRVNTRKNKGGAQSVSEVLAKKADEKEDPVLRQRLLKEVFDEQAQKGKKDKRRKTVVWAEELAHYQSTEGRKADGEKDKENEVEKEDKKNAVKVGLRSKIALGTKNGTPAPKRKRTRS